PRLGLQAQPLERGLGELKVVRRTNPSERQVAGDVSEARLTEVEFGGSACQLNDIGPVLVDFLATIHDDVWTGIHRLHRLEVESVLRSKLLCLRQGKRSFVLGSASISGESEELEDTFLDLVHKSLRCCRC